MLTRAVGRFSVWYIATDEQIGFVLVFAIWSGARRQHGVYPSRTPGPLLFSLRSGGSISNWLIPKGFLISFLQFYYLCVYDNNLQLDPMLSHEARVHVPERV